MKLERMVSNRGSTYRLLAYVLALVMVVGSLVACLPSNLPTQGPTQDSTQGTTQGLVPTQPTPPPVTVELSSKIDSAGILLEDVRVISGDGVAVLYLAKGARALDASGKPLDSITVSAGQPQVPWYERYQYGLAYDFSPRGARFVPQARLTISYNPYFITESVSEPQIGYFKEAESAWILLEVTEDFNIHCVTAGIDHLGTFVLFFEILWIPPRS